MKSDQANENTSPSLPSGLQMNDDPSCSSSIIRTNGLCKRYGRVEALNHLDINVRSGGVYGFLGRNGAGKSTTIRIIMGISKADKGSVRLFGKKSLRSHTKQRQRIGYVAQEQNFYGWMTAKTVGEFVRGFYPTWDDNEYRRLLNALELPVARKIRTFSGGMRAKLALALALAHKPSLLVLDEPTAGLDPVARREFIEMIRTQAEDSSRTTFFSSHLIDEVEAAADQVGIIENGKICYEGSLEQLRDSVRLFRVNADLGDTIETLPSTLTQLSGVRVLVDRKRQNERHLIVSADDPNLFKKGAIQYGSWTIERMSLEDIFIAMVGKTINSL